MTLTASIYMESRIICGRFRVKAKLGSGSFGDIFRGEDMKTKQPVAVKVEKLKTEVPQLHEESRVYQRMAGGVHVPQHFFFGSDSMTRVMAIELLGKNVEDHFEECKRKFSVKTVLMLADQMISALEFFHKMGYIHRDVKPENFVTGLGNKEGQIFMIDYGLAKAYRNLETGEHIKFSERNPMTGTARYASINSLRGVEQSRRDDIEGLAYVLIYLLKGTFPWMNLAGEFESLQAKHERIAAIKGRVTPEELCAGLPDEFAKFLAAARRLKFLEEPDYEGYRKMFRDLFIKLKYVYDECYDWKAPIASRVARQGPVLTPLRPRPQVRRSKSGRPVSSSVEPLVLPQQVETRTRKVATRRRL